MKKEELDNLLLLLENDFKKEIRTKAKYELLEIAEFLKGAIDEANQQLKISILDHEARLKKMEKDIHAPTLH